MAVSGAFPSAPPLPCRDELKRHYNLGEYWIEVEMEDLASFDEDLADSLYKQPAEHLELVSRAQPKTPVIYPDRHSWLVSSCAARGSGQGGG